MKPPENYKGPLQIKVPFCYYDVTSMWDSQRTGIPTPDHPYYQLRDKIASALERHQTSGNAPVITGDVVMLADIIMEAL